MTDLLTPPIPLFSKTRKGGDLQNNSAVWPWKSPSLKPTQEVFERAGVSQLSLIVIIHIIPKIFVFKFDMTI